MRKDFRRGRLLLCRTAVEHIVDSIQLMVGPDTVTNTCYNKGRFRGEPSFVSIKKPEELTLNTIRLLRSRKRTFVSLAR
jgi:hypothetical protein